MQRAHARAAFCAGIDAQFHPWPTGAPSTEVVRRPSVQPAFAYVGRLAPEKGVLELLAAFEQVIDHVGASRLEIAGDGPLRGRVEAEIARRRLARNVTVHGWLDRAELDAILATAWATVVPSQWEEPLGLVAVESIVRGVPVIASAMGGLTEAGGGRSHGASGSTRPGRARGRAASRRDGGTARAASRLAGRRRSARTT